MTRLASPLAGPSPHRVPTDFTEAPFLVIWEATRACALACVHCRADAIARRDPRELTTPEAFALIDQVCAFAEHASTGRGASLEQVSAEECEQVLHDLHELSGRVPFGIKTTEAPHYRRVRMEGAVRGSTAVPLLAPRAVNDGNDRDDPLFVRLRDPDALEGECGRCPFRALCGGSRSRALRRHGQSVRERSAVRLPTSSE